MNEIKEIVIVSDGTGKTAKRLMDAVLAQYADTHVEFSIVQIYQQVRTIKEIDVILTTISRDVLVIFSIISSKIRQHFCKAMRDKDVLYLNVLEPMLKTMKKFLGVDPNFKPGLLQIIDDSYYRKIDSIGYTVEHDDGRGFQLDGADIILLGVSRTCKTPISMYMACNHGLRVANIPIVINEHIEAQIRKRLQGIDREKIFGLVMSPDVLSSIRMDRCSPWLDKIQKQRHLENYFSINEIRKEVRFCRQLFDGLEIEEIVVTRRAIEEVSREIMDKLGYLTNDEL